MKPILNQQIIDKYILNEFGEISNPPIQDEIKRLINNDSLTLEVVKLWSLFGGDLMIKGNEQGRTIIHSASRMGQLDIVEYVLDKGVDVDYLNVIKETPLIYASCKGQVEVINYLLNKGANINHQSYKSWSVLHYACNWNQLESVKVLIDRGIDLKDDNTALDIAIRYKNQKIIDYLTPFYNK